MTYNASGVNIDAGNDLVSAIKRTANSTGRLGVASELGGFGAIFDLKSTGYIDPLLVTGTDGVGTKLLIASTVGQHDTIGIDLVAMCVNDIVVLGAEPLFFLDYFATGILDVSIGRTIIEGIAEGCRKAGCALIGGETAEMPGMYSSTTYDLAGFCVGAVERNKILNGKQVKEGDVILGLASSGLHSNGFSLVRRIIESAGVKYEQPSPLGGKLTVGQTLLAPTKIYVNSCISAIEEGGIHGLAHITGGGFIENIPRVLPDGLAASIYGGEWKVPDIFKWIKGIGNVPEEEMLRTFNCGIGMAAIVAPEDSNKLKKIFRDTGETVFEIGRIIRNDDDNMVSIENPESLWKK